LPFSKKPEADPEFDLFFSKAWLDTFTISLHNFLSTVFQNMRKSMIAQPGRNQTQTGNSAIWPDLLISAFIFTRFLNHPIDSFAESSLLQH
jgi:hypothetical protein